MTRNALGKLLATAFACTALVFGAGALAGCGSQQADDAAPASADTQTLEGSQEVQPTIEVTMSVNGEARQEVTVPDDATVLDVLRASGQAFETEKSSYGEYVTSIEGTAAEGDKGWLFSVNGEQPTVGAGECKVAQGDEVVWTYGSYE